MAQFDVYPSKDNSTPYPLFVDIQSELLTSLHTRVVIPLTPISLLETKVPDTLCPIFHLEQGEFVLMTQFMSSIASSALGAPVASLSNFREDIIRAADLLITGV